MPLPRPEKLIGLVDEDKWGKPFDPSNENNTQLAAETYLLYCMNSYKYDKFCDYELFDALTEDFQGWTEETFNLVGTDTNRRFRDFIRHNGVFVPKARKPIPKALEEMINSEECPTWPPEDLEKQKRDRIMNSRFDERSPKHTEHFAQASVANPKAPITAPKIDHEGIQPSQYQRPGHVRQQSTLRDQSDRSYWLGNTPTRPRHTSFEPGEPSRLPPRIPLQARSNQEDIRPPSEAHNYEDQPTHELANLSKCYVNNTSIQFGGETYDFIDTKLQMFYDNCIRCGLAPIHWHKAFSLMLKGKARQFYYDHLFNSNLSFDQLVQRVTERFHSLENRQMYMREWQSISLVNIIRTNPEKSRLQCLEMMIEKLYLVQKGLPTEQRSEIALRDQLLSACQGIKECELALYKPANTFEKLCDELRSAIGTAQRMTRTSSQFIGELEEQEEQFWTDRTYGRNKDKHPSRPKFRKPSHRPASHPNEFRSKRCFICKKMGCWSTKHTPEERKRNYERFRNRSGNKSKEYLQQFLYEFEGIQTDEYDEDPENDQDVGALITEFDQSGSESEDTEEPEQFFASFMGCDINGPDTIAVLHDNITVHQFVKADPKDNQDMHSVFASNVHRYSSEVFHGILPDSGAASISTAGHSQFRALQKIDNVKLDTTSAGMHKIRFGKGSASSLGTTRIRTPIGVISFHVVPTHTPFLLSLRDMDRLGVKLDNLTNELIQGEKRIPIIRKWGHPWLLLHTPEQTAACHLTELELRQLHRRFGHPSVRKLTNLLERAQPNEHIDKEALERISRKCHACQLSTAAPGRFRFRLKDDREFIFNYEIIVDIFYLEGRPTIHVVDSATSFQAARFLKDQTTKTIWNTIKECWIDTYLGPPEYLRHDAGRNFASTEFKTNALSMSITTLEVPVEAHNSIGKVERYHTLLRRAYEIIRYETSGTMSTEQALQAAVKAVNDTAGPNGLVPTLLVFGAYPRVTQSSPPNSTTHERAEAIRKAMREVQKLKARTQVSSALGMRNGPDTNPTKLLPLQSDVKVWREKNGWTGPFKLLDVSEETCTVAMPRGPAQFRTTVVRPYDVDVDNEPNRTSLRATSEDVTQPPDNAQMQPNNEDALPRDEASGHETNAGTSPDMTQTDPGINPDNSQTDPDRRQTRTGQHTDYPKTAQGQPTDNTQTNQRHGTDNQGPQLRPYPDEPQTDAQPPRRKRGRPRKYPIAPGLNSDQARREIITPPRKRGRPRKNITAFLNTKEEQSQEESKRLRKSGVITTPGKPFETSDKAEIDALIQRGVFRFEMFDPKTHGGERIFKSRMVQEVKGIGSDSPYEKSRLVIQGYADAGKDQILTQSPTLQRASQRLILSIAPALQKEFKLDIWIRDVKQAYTQSKTDLVRPILARLPEQIRHRHPEGTILRIIKPLYGIAEAGTHWWATYSKHHQEKLHMVTSTFDPCLLISKDPNRKAFGLVGMQTDDTLILCNSEFAQLEECQLQEAQFMAKAREALRSDNDLIFNGCRVKTKDQCIYVQQKGQSQKIALVNMSEKDPNQQYIEQRARGAYIATICQPEASFDLSVAAQHQKPEESEIKDLNKRLKWQIENPERGLTFIPFNIREASLFVFVDASFANNKDMSSQLGYLIMLGEEERDSDSFRIRGNIVHYSSTKCKRVTRSVLASEIYGMVSGVDMAYAIGTTLNMITDELNLPKIETIICTDSYSLYECLVKLGTTKEKRLMIDIMSLRQSYEKRELYEIRWIDGADNPADAFTKRNPNKSLKSIIEANTAQIRIEGWVDRTSIIQIPETNAELRGQAQPGN